MHFERFGRADGSPVPAVERRVVTTKQRKPGVLRVRASGDTMSVA
jgi:hypothetical protein